MMGSTSPKRPRWLDFCQESNVKGVNKGVVSPNLLADLNEVVRLHPRLDSLLDDFVTVVLTSGSNGASTSKPGTMASNGNGNDTSSGSHPIQLTKSDLGMHHVTIHDVGFVNPRKRGSLKLHSNQLLLVAGDSVIESVPMSEITKVICVPTPGKQQLHYSVSIFHNHSGSAHGSPIIFGFDETNSMIKCTKQEGSSRESKLELDKQTAKRKAILELFGQAFGQQRWSKILAEPEAKVFKSVSNASDRTKGAFYHIAAHLKAKEGYLYFLESGIFYGFKKPSLFLSTRAIESATVSSITSRTFSIVISSLDETKKGDATVTVTYEFEMLDGQELQGVVRYFERLGLSVGGGVSSTLTTTSSTAPSGSSPLSTPRKEQSANSPSGAGMQVSLSNTGEAAYDEAKDGDYVSGDESNDDDDLAEEYDSEHDSDGDRDSNDSSEDEEDEDGEDDEDRDTEEEQPRETKRKQNDRIATSERSKRQKKVQDEEESPSDEEEVDELI